MNVHAAKTQFSKLLARVEAGEEITIARNGKPVARLVPAERPRERSPAPFGWAKDMLQIHGDINEPLPDDILDAFDNGPIFPDEASGEQT